VLDEMKCPACGKMIMSIKKVESLFRNTTIKVLLIHWLCGEAFEIRFPIRNVFEISTSSGERLEQFVEDGEGSS